MNPYFIRSSLMLIASAVFTIFNFEKLDLIYGATLAVLVYSIFDNYVPPKPLLHLKQSSKEVKQ